MVNQHFIGYKANIVQKIICLEIRDLLITFANMFSNIEFWVKTPNWVPNLLKQATWQIPSQQKMLYLTFDDGPTPDATEWVLEQLQQYNAKATFFLIGENVEKNRKEYEILKASPHQIGNHTYNHLSGWKTKNKTYFDNIEQANELIQSPFFRPPYGKLKWSQYQQLKKQYRLIMWDVVPGDFLPNVDGNECFRRIKKYAKPGSIIVLHDSEKCFETVKVCLPQVLEYFSNEGYTFESVF